MVNKPLVTGTNIQGTLTYNDSNPYSYEEAIDTLNLMLSMKGVMLVEAGNNLRLVPLKELPVRVIADEARLVFWHVAVEAALESSRTAGLDTASVQ